MLEAASTWWSEARGRLARWGVREIASVLGFWVLMSAVGMIHGWGAWSLLSLPLFVALIGALTWLATALLRPIPRFDPKQPHVIYYTSTEKKVTTLARLSLADGVATAAWSVLQGDGDDERIVPIGETPLDVASFRAIWRRARATRALKAYSTRRQRGARRAIDLSFHAQRGAETVVANFAMPRQGLPRGIEDLLARIRVTTPAS